MNEDLYEDLVVAISEDYSFEELRDLAFMRKELSYFLFLIPIEVEALIEGALEIKGLWGNRVPSWKLLLVEH